MGSVAVGRPERRPEGRSWWGVLDDRGKRAFRASFAGFSLDAFDLIILTLSLTAIGATFDVGTGATGALSTVNLAASAVGGIIAGLLADRIGRARTLMITVAVYSVFSLASAFAPSYEVLLVLRVFQGLGFGGEWAVGAVLVAEFVRPESRGKALGMIQSAWAIGWAIAVVAYTIVFSLAADETAWRILMVLGFTPALLILYIRRHVRDAEVFAETQAEEEQGLTVVGTAGYLAVVIAGAFAGYVSAGFVHDRLGRKPAFRLFASLAGVSLVAYFLVPEGANAVLVAVGFPLGFFASGCFSGFGSYLSELFPTRVRATASGFCYNVGRGIGALFPGIIGFLAAVIGLGGAVAFGVLGYVLAIAALAFLPETQGEEFVALR